MGVEIDTSQVRSFAADLRNLNPLLARHVKPVVNKGALNIKNQLQQDFRNSRHFKGVRDVSYDILGDGYEAEIGPSAEPGASGNIANIAYFGGAYGGGGTVPDPRVAGEDELPNFEKAIADAVEGLF